MSKGAQDSRSEADEVLGEVVRHLEWLRDAGVRDVPLRAAGGRAAARGAAGTQIPTRAATRAPTATPTSTSHRPASASTRESRRASTPTSPGHAAPNQRRNAPPTSPVERPPNPSPGYSQADKGCGSSALLAIREEVGECARCKLAGGRTKLVFGVGNPSAELMFVGEGPGADEDAQGEPFVGKAGQLLTRMIEAMGFRREDVYIANVVKCRPPGNRDPEGDEIAACEPFLKAQIAAVKPRVLVALGRFAVQTLLRDTTPISRQRGRWRTYEGVRLMPTFHPAYLLRNPAEKKRAWEDLQLVMTEFGKSPPAR